MPLRSPSFAALSVAPSNPPERVGEALARATLELARLPRESALLAEERQGPPGWELRLTGRAGLLELLAARFSECGVDVAPVATGPAHFPDRVMGCEEFAVVEPVAPVEPVGRPERAIEPATAEERLGPVAVPLAEPRAGAAGLWFGLQTHLRPDGRGTVELWMRLRGAGPPGSASAVERIAPELGARGSLQGLPVAELRSIRPGGRTRREWESGAVRRFRSARPFTVRSDLVGRLLAAGVPGPAEGSAELRHTICFGASGSGKSAFLAEIARERVRAGRPSVVLDVHGSLGPELLAGLTEAERRRMVAIDPTSPFGSPGLALLRGGSGPAAELERAQLLAAFRRLGARDGEVYWGFRIDRVLDCFLALTQESGGDLRALGGLLTDPHRRELARLGTRSPTLAAFLEELPGLLRRNPEFLWP
ncbi:MAG: hypothetical protein L3J72_02655, partial [Thermoplasmata archaeon]|nr:hypothetical protein [Thermoplasmata archaeon]